jgi:hypothetical protein
MIVQCKDEAHRLRMRRHIPTTLLLLLLLVSLVARADAQPIKVESGSNIAFMGDSITDQGWKHPATYVTLVVHGLEATKIILELESPMKLPLNHDSSTNNLIRGCRQRPGG